MSLTLGHVVHMSSLLNGYHIPVKLVLVKKKKKKTFHFSIL